MCKPYFHSKTECGTVISVDIAVYFEVVILLVRLIKISPCSFWILSKSRKPTTTYAVHLEDEKLNHHFMLYAYAEQILIRKNAYSKRFNG
jgi:hypothetical protein